MEIIDKTNLKFGGKEVVLSRSSKTIEIVGKENIIWVISEHQDGRQR